MADNVWVESDCTIEHDGKTFTSGGAVITPDYAVGYAKFESDMFEGVTGDMTDWHGNRLGVARIVSRWQTPRSYVSSHMYQIEACINGVWYTGRCAGSGMIWKGKRCKRQ